MSGSGIAQFIPLILIFVIFYFFLIRPQQKKMKDHKSMVASLKRGDDGITTGGIIGRVERVLENDKIEVAIADDINVQLIKSSGIQALVDVNKVKKHQNDNKNREIDENHGKDTKMTVKVELL